MTTKRILVFLSALGIGLLLGQFSFDREVNAQTKAKKKLVGIAMDGADIYRAFSDGTVEQCEIVDRQASVSSVSAPRKVSSVSMRNDLYEQRHRDLTKRLENRRIVCVPLPVWP